MEHQLDMGFTFNEVVGPNPMRVKANITVAFGKVLQRLTDHITDERLPY